jgi:ABC-type antimicrobial peptide transport system permease subunit
MTVKLSAFIYVLMGLLMAIACANVAALVLARSAGRSREISVRLSLGATRWQIARQLLIESFALALVGCMAGTMAALWMTQVLIARLSTPFQYVEVPVGPFR